MNRFLLTSLIIWLATAGLFSCERKPAGKVEKPVPQVFTPVAEPDSAEVKADTLAVADLQPAPETTEPAVPEIVKRPPMPTVAELKKVTPTQEAKRALNNDVMQIYRMRPEAFYKYMQSRIPYYRGKGNLKAENDMLRLEITEKEMIIETPKGRQTFQMQ